LERKDIFVTTKLAPIHARPEYVVKAFEDSLANLNIEYIDLYMLHWPTSLNPATGQAMPMRSDGSRDLDEELNGKFEITWGAMEKLLDTGKVKSLGVANFSIPNLEHLLKTSKVVPAVNQVELHRKYISFNLKVKCLIITNNSLFASKQIARLLCFQGYSLFCLLAFGIISIYFTAR
jgi:diketogulonate reductase-like aldo/keto reductase